jgi:hypothetical protein
MRNLIFFPLLVLLLLSGISYSQVFTDSNLPIIIIYTDGGAEIPDDPRILATMKIISRGEGLRNNVADVGSPEYLDYDGRINIELRGSSSQAMDKKAYGLSTKKADGVTNNNVSLLGMPADNDWILLNNVFDPSMIRNYLSYNLSRMIGEYASRTVFCELVINGYYMGLYLLLEKIKPGPFRVNIHEIGPDDNSYPDITGGYITKSDKTTGGDPVAWYMSSYNWENDVAFIHDKPEPENVTSEQNQYIMSEFMKLSSTASSGNQSPETGYPSVIDVPTFIDYIILNELASNADAYHLSTFYHKDRNGKLRAGPLWDMDLTYGNDLFLWGFDRSKTNFWQFSNGENDGPRYWKDLFDNKKFRCYLSRRWNELRGQGQPLNYSAIASLIDQTVALISEALVREDERWGTVGNHTQNIADMKTFLQERIAWITNNVGSSSDCADPYIPPLVITKIMYAPDTSFTFPVSSDQEFIEIKNTGTDIVDLTGIYFGGTGFVYKFPAKSVMKPGESKIIAGNYEVFMSKYGFYPFGKFSRNLSNTGEKLILLDAFGNIIDLVEYSDMPPWPDAKYNGFWLELTDPASDNNLASNWIASTSVLTSVGNEHTDPGLNLYPLPVTDILRIESEVTILSLELYDIVGTRLKSLSVKFECYDLDLTSYPPGIYLIKVSVPGGKFVRKIIKE